MPDLAVIGAGAVTAVGLDLRQTAAAFVAGVEGFSERVAPDASPETQIVARIPAGRRLRRDPAEWLLNLADRAGAEALHSARADPARTLLLCAPPPTGRNHPCWRATDPDAFRRALSERLGGPFAPGSQLVDGGAAALVGALAEAGPRLGRDADRILAIGVDSLLNAADIGALRRAGRLHGQTSQGVIPGEAAAAIVLARGTAGPLVVRSVGLAREQDDVLGERQSQGRGMLSALAQATAPYGCAEEAVAFIVANFNGERFQALEALLFRSRFYRSHREVMPVAYPAMCCGETGAAGGLLAIALAAEAFGGGYAPGRHAMLEVWSDNDLRAAAFLSGSAT